MLSTEFDFYAPGLARRSPCSERGEGAKVLSGGMSMMPAMNLGILRPTPSSRSTTSESSTT